MAPTSPFKVPIVIGLVNLFAAPLNVLLSLKSVDDAAVPAATFIVTGVAPSTVNAVQVALPVHVAVVVAAPYTPAVPFDTSTLLEPGCVVVAKPTQFIVFPVRIRGVVKVNAFSLPLKVL